MRLLLVCFVAGGLVAAPDVFEAIRAGDVSVVKSLPVAARADGTTPLMHAVVTADAAMVKLLLENKADVRAVNSGGFTALHYALSDLEKTRLLLAAGADANAAAKNGLTPLRIASSRKGSGRLLRPCWPPGLSRRRGRWRRLPMRGSRRRCWRS